MHNDQKSQSTSPQTDIGPLKIESNLVAKPDEQKDCKNYENPAPGERYQSRRDPSEYRRVPPATMVMLMSKGLIPLAPLDLTLYGQEYEREGLERLNARIKEAAAAVTPERTAPQHSQAQYTLMPAQRQISEAEQQSATASTSPVTPITVQNNGPTT